MKKRIKRFLKSILFYNSDHIEVEIIHTKQYPQLVIDNVTYSLTHKTILYIISKFTNINSVIVSINRITDDDVVLHKTLIIDHTMVGNAIVYADETNAKDNSDKCSFCEQYLKEVFGEIPDTIYVSY